MRYLIPLSVLLLAWPDCGPHHPDDDDDTPPVTQTPGDDDDATGGDDDDATSGDDDDATTGDDDDATTGDDDDATTGDDDDATTGDDDDTTTGDDDDTTYPDLDGDGYTADVDCNDSNASINPGTPEICDEIDNNCDGDIDDTDVDQDAYSACDTGDMRDCNDLDPDVYPGGTEYCNMNDDDCDGEIDEDGNMDADGDGFSVCAGDCRDEDPTQYPNIADSGWIEYLCNPVLPNTPGAESVYSDQASVMYNPSALVGERYRAWYRAGNEENATEIAYATSPDGVHWTKQGVVMSLGDTGAFDDIRLNYPSVLRRSDGTYHMWYHGLGATTLLLEIGYATSPDGIHWTRENGGLPVLQSTPDGWDSKAVQSPTVLWYNLGGGSGLYSMWYGGTDIETNTLQIGYATSSDGIEWFKRDGDPTTAGVDPVLRVGSPGTWDDDRVTFPRVVDNGAFFEMFYSGLSSVTNLSYDIGYASSTNGTRWTRYEENPVMRSVGTEGPEWRADLVYSPSIVLTRDEEDRLLYKMWFSGGASSSGPFQTGLATNIQPEVSIVAPPALSFAASGQAVTFQGFVDEPYFVENVELRLESDLDGELAVGSPDTLGYFTLVGRVRTQGLHTLSVISQDEGGVQSRDQVQVIVNASP